MIAEAHNVRLLVAVVRNPEEVPIAREASANRVRQIQAMVARAQHNLCRPERTRRNHQHQPGTHHARFGDGMQWGITLVLNPVPAASDRLDLAYSHLRREYSSLILGPGKCVRVER